MTTRSEPVLDRNRRPPEAPRPAWQRYGLTLAICAAPVVLAWAADTGADLAKAQAAALTKVPGGTVLRAESNGDGSGFHLLVQQPDGSVVMVQLDASFTVTGVAQGPGGRGGPGLDPNGPLQNHDPNGTLLNQDPNGGTPTQAATGATT